MQIDNEFILTIIIPAYNSERYIRKCLDSILAQDNRDVKIIIVDDGSTDSTSEICRNYENNNITYYYKSNGGVSSARNFGLDLVRSNYVMFVDSDDELLEGALSTIKSMLNNKSWYDWYFYEYVTSNNGIMERQRNLPNDIKNMWIEIAGGYSIHSPFNKIYKMELIGNIRFNESFSKGEDYLFNFEYAKRVKTFLNIYKPLYKYRIDNMKSAMHQYNFSDFEMSVRLHQQVSCYFRNEKEDAELDYLVKRRFFLEVIKNCNDLINTYNNYFEIRPKIQEIFNNKLTRECVKLVKQKKVSIPYKIETLLISKKMALVYYEYRKNKNKLKCMRGL